MSEKDGKGIICTSLGARDAHRADRGIRIFWPLHGSLFLLNSSQKLLNLVVHESTPAELVTIVHCNFFVNSLHYKNLPQLLKLQRLHFFQTKTKSVPFDHRCKIHSINLSRQARFKVLLLGPDCNIHHAGPRRSEMDARPSSRWRRELMARTQISLPYIVITFISRNAPRDFFSSHMGGHRASSVP